MRTARLRIAGHVQGVGYRAWAMRLAADLGVRGWVRNRRGGEVEILMTGAEAAVAAFIEACGTGPRGARVSAVAVGNAEDDGSSGFSARPNE